MMKAPLRPGTRPVGAAQLAVEDTSTDGPEFAATPEGDGPRLQDRRGGVRVDTYLLIGATFAVGDRSFRCPRLPPPTHNREPYDTLLYCPLLPLILSNIMSL
jgi:hypothetical protein